MDGSGMLYDHRKLLADPGQLAGLELSLDGYLAVANSTPESIAAKKKGPARDELLAAIAQMAMLFACAKSGSAEEYRKTFFDLLDSCKFDSAVARGLRIFYLSNAAAIPEVHRSACERMRMAKPALEAIPIAPNPRLESF